MNIDKNSSLLALSSDLKRISLSIQRNSPASANRFNQEADKWLKLSSNTSDKSIKKLLSRVETTLKQKNNLKKAEDCLMYSTLLQNRSA